MIKDRTAYKILMATLGVVCICVCVFLGNKCVNSLKFDVKKSCVASVRGDNPECKDVKVEEQLSDSIFIFDVCGKKQTYEAGITSCRKKKK